MILSHIQGGCSELFVYHHLGLGDCLDCNGMVRYLLKHNVEKIYLISKIKYEKMVSYMYRDEPRIVVLSIEAATRPQERKEALAVAGDKPLLMVGHDFYPHKQEQFLGEACAELFYEQLMIPFEERFSSWYLERDHGQEEQLLAEMNPAGKDYVFVHDDPSRGFKIENEKIFELYGGKILVLRNDVTKNIFHFMKLLECAKQIHLMESSFKSLVEILDRPVDCYFHNFRSGASSMLGRTRQAWKEIKY